MPVPDVDLQAIRADVATLAARPRPSARAGEREAARWVAERLATLGLAPERLAYRYQHSYALAHAVHELAGLLGVALGGRRGALLTAAALASLDAEASGRSQWLRALLPAGEGDGVLARIPAGADRPRHTLVLVAHLDAANTGWVWHPRLADAGAARAQRTQAMAPLMAPLTAALLAGTAGSLTPLTSRAGRALRTAAAAVLGVGLAGLASVGRGATVPGASDNATGVAVLLDLARALAADPPRDVEVVLVFPGTEEAGMGGMRAALSHPWLATLDAGTTTVVGVDTLGGGTPIVARAEGTMRTHRFDPAAVELVRRGAVQAGVEPPAPWRIGGWTDPVLARHRGLSATCLLAVRGGHYSDYHLPTDTPSRVDWGCVEACARIVAGTVAAAGDGGD